MTIGNLRLGDGEEGHVARVRRHGLDGEPTAVLTSSGASYGFTPREPGSDVSSWVLVSSEEDALYLDGLTAREGGNPYEVEWLTEYPPTEDT